MLRLLLALVLSAGPLCAATYYVATNGSDANTGTLSAPFRHIGYGLSRIWAGDTLLIRGGTYDEYVYLRNKSGRADARITVGNYNSESVTVRGNTAFNRDVASGWTNDGYNVWWMKNCNYFYLYGIKLDGRCVDSNTAGRSSNWRETGGFGLTSDGGTASGCTFIEFRYCWASNCGGNGFGVQYSDRITIDNCATWDCALASPWGGAGYSLFQMRWLVAADSEGYHNRITNCTANWNRQPQVTTAHIDGNGIILDGANDAGTLWQEGGTYLIRGNSCENNGGTGIIAFYIKYANIQGNTVKNNCSDSTYPGRREIDVENSEQVNLNGNLITPRSGNYAIECINTRTLWSYSNNLGGGSTRQSGCSDVRAWQ